jgi:hypothetical protein
VALFQLKSSSNEEMEFERVRFRELGCGCSKQSGICVKEVWVKKYFCSVGE